MILTQYSLVTQAPGNKPYTVCAYSGTDLSQIIRITQAKNMPEETYGWVLTCGHVSVATSDETKPAFADFKPNDARLRLSGKWPKETQQHSDESTESEKDKRLSLLPALLIEAGPYCNLLREARDVFVDGHFYACVAMCGISFERFQRDKAKPHGGTDKHKIWEIRKLLKDKNILSSITLKLCKNMATMRNTYAHGHGLDPNGDASNALKWMHSFIERETDLMRDYVVVDGILNRKRNPQY